MNAKGFGKLAMRAVLGLTFVLTSCSPSVPEVEPERETVVVTEEVQVVVTAAAEPTEEPQTIVIGAVAPLSAPGAYLAGTEMVQAVEMAVDEINEQGGLLGKQVELILGDTEGLPESGTAVAERLVTQNHVVAIVGEFHSGPALATLEVVHKYHVPYIVVDAWNNDITGSGYPEVFRVSPSAQYYTDVIADYISDAGFTRVVHINENTDYGIQQGEEFEVQMADRGIEVLTMYAEPETEDFTPILQRIQEDPPDLLATDLVGVAAYRLIRQACELGLAPTPETAFFGNIDFQYPEFWENVGDCGQYSVFPYVGTPGVLRTDTSRGFIENFEARYNQQAGGAAMGSYDAIKLLFAAIETAGSTDPDAIIEALEGIRFEGVRGTTWFEYTSQNPVPSDMPAWLWHQWTLPALYILQYLEVDQPMDEASVIYPESVATGLIYTQP